MAMKWILLAGAAIVTLIGLDRPLIHLATHAQLGILAAIFALFFQAEERSARRR
jgi:hypothetical protein